MKCDNKICIYQKNNMCTLEEIEIDWRGNCKRLIKARITEDILDFCKLYTNLMIENKEDYSFNPATGEVNHTIKHNKQIK